MAPAETYFEATMLFVGVTTKQSFVHQVFQPWMRLIGRKAVLEGIDIPLDASVDQYRSVVLNIKSNAMLLGALVTSHKANLFRASRDLFDHVSEASALLEEAGAIYKCNGTLACEASDPFAGYSAIERILTMDRGSWPEVAILGAGGAGLAIAYMFLKRADIRPVRLCVADISPWRLELCRRVLKEYSTGVNVEIVDISDDCCDGVVECLAKGALIINATGMGKDRPGSPLSDKCRFPHGATAWDLNYRGERHFLKQAQAQRDRAGLHIVDGWHYFVCGWYEVITRVFGVKREADLLAGFVAEADIVR